MAFNQSLAQLADRQTYRQTAQSKDPLEEAMRKFEQRKSMLNKVGADGTLLDRANEWSGGALQARKAMGDGIKDAALKGLAGDSATAALASSM